MNRLFMLTTIGLALLFTVGCGSPLSYAIGSMVCIHDTGHSDCSDPEAEKIAAERERRERPAEEANNARHWQARELCEHKYHGIYDGNWRNDFTCQALVRYRSPVGLLWEYKAIDLSAALGGAK